MLSVAICGGDGQWHEARGIVVRPDAEHSFDCNGALGVMLFVDPESSEGAWLSTSLRQDITIVPDMRLESLVQELGRFAEQPDDVADIAALVRRCIQGLRPGLAPARRLDARVTTVLDVIRASDDLRMSLDQAADTVFAALREAQPGETWVPRAPSATVEHIARALIGSKPVQTRVIGIRPGEKMHEIMVSEEEAHHCVRRGEYFAILPMLPELRAAADEPNALQGEFSSADSVLDLESTRQLLGKHGLLP